MCWRLTVYTVDHGLRLTEGIWRVCASLETAFF